MSKNGSRLILANRLWPIRGEIPQVLPKKVTVNGE